MAPVCSQLTHQNLCCRFRLLWTITENQRFEETTETLMIPRGVYLSVMRADNGKEGKFFMINVRIEMQLEEVFH